MKHNNEHTHKNKNNHVTYSKLVAAAPIVSELGYRPANIRVYSDLDLWLANAQRFTFGVQYKFSPLSNVAPAVAATMPWIAKCRNVSADPLRGVCTFHRAYVERRNGLKVPGVIATILFEAGPEAVDSLSLSPPVMLDDSLAAYSGGILVDGTFARSRENIAACVSSLQGARAIEFAGLFDGTTARPRWRQEFLNDEIVKKTVLIGADAPYPPNSSVEQWSPFLSTLQKNCIGIR